MQILLNNSHFQKFYKFDITYFANQITKQIKLNSFSYFQIAHLSFIEVRTFSSIYRVILIKSHLIVQITSYFKSYL